jgi:beta-phosphoglucomutase
MFPDAVIFDFDGVIVDTEPIHYHAFQNVLGPLGLGYSWEEYTVRYMGFDDRDAFREAFLIQGRDIDEHVLKELINLKASIFEHVVKQGIKPYPGVLELIKELTENKVALAISSGALRSDIMPILDQLNIHIFFTHIITAEDVSHSKPDPASYTLAKEKLISSFPNNLSSSSLIYAIEDTPAGIQSAKAAGLNVVAITNSYPSTKLLQADIIIDNLLKLSGGLWS